MTPSVAATPNSSKILAKIKKKKKKKNKSIIIYLPALNHRQHLNQNQYPLHPLPFSYFPVCRIGKSFDLRCTASKLNKVNSASRLQLPTSSSSTSQRIWDMPVPS